MISLLLLSTSLLIITNSISTVSNTWTDDFSFDINGTNGWTNNIITIGRTRNYHGWYNKPPTTNIPSLSRSFQCMNPSYITISFTLYYQCNIKPNDGIKLYLNNNTNEEFYITYNNNNYKSFNTHIDGICQINAQNINYTIVSNPLSIFTIHFIFELSTINNAFIAMSNIQIQCDNSLPDSLEPTLEPTLEPIGYDDGILLEAFEPNTTTTTTVSSSTKLKTINKTSENTDLKYLFNWWRNNDNMGWKVFIIVSILCAIIGCILITCIIGYFTGKHKPKNKIFKYYNKNKHYKNKKSIEYMKPIEETSKENDIKMSPEITLSTHSISNNMEIKPIKMYSDIDIIEVDIESDYDSINNKIQTNTQTHLQIENEPQTVNINRNVNNIELSYSGNISVSPININHTMDIDTNIPIPNINNIQLTNIKSKEFKPFYSLPNINSINNNSNRINNNNRQSNISTNTNISNCTTTTATATATNTNISDSISSETSEISESESHSHTFPTNTETECTNLMSIKTHDSEEKKFQIDTIKCSVATNMTNVTDRTYNTFSESDISKTKTQSDYREYTNSYTINNTQIINTIHSNGKKHKILYFNNYNDQMELVEKDEFNPQTETEMSGEMDEHYHNQW